MTRALPFPEQPKDPVTERRLANLEQRSLSRPATTPPPELSVSGSRSSEYVIAAADSSDLAKAGADVVCSGSGDAATIQAILDAVDGPTDSGWNGEVRLMAGQYVLGGYGLLVDGYTTLRGSGRGTYIDGEVYLDGQDITLADMSVNGNILYFSGSHHYLRGIECGWTVQVGSRGAIEGSIVGQCSLKGEAAIAHGVTFHDVLSFEPGSFRCRASDIVVGNNLTGQLVTIDGTDNAVHDSTFGGRSDVDGTGDLVIVKGTNNNFVDNIVRGTNGAFRPAYAVTIDAAASGARVVNNDLRPRVGTWATGDINDLGTGSIVRDNDS